MGNRDLPLASGDRHARAFERLGWTREAKAGKGSHIIVAKDGRRVTIPGHREVSRATLATALKAAGIGHADYLAAFK